LTGAVASERVSEALKGSLRMVGNHSKSAKAEGSLTVTPTGGTGTKVGLSDPVVAGPKGWAVRPLKRYASWVQNVVRQFGPYPAQAEDI